MEKKQKIVRKLTPTQSSASLNVPISGSSDPAAIFAENCIRCHGATGAGDGELVQSGQITDIPDFTDPASIQDMSLDAWFEVITNGRLDKLMPPWRDSLSEEQRWAVAYYTYTMSYDAENVTQGEALFTQNCAECHSEDSTEEAPSVIGLTSYTESDLVSFVSSHATELELDAPTDIPDSTALVQYLRTLSSTVATPAQSASADDGSLTSAELAATAHAG
ncbi:c-type cytochrome, partial [Candidatus Saccharibacteria bacterium]|nr:c-type cytochrome [Candidatus Saccharibacteria bacterium]